MHSSFVLVCFTTTILTIHMFTNILFLGSYTQLGQNETMGQLASLTLMQRRQRRPMITHQGWAEIRPLGSICHDSRERRAEWDIDEKILEGTEVESCEADDTPKHWAPKLNVTEFKIAERSEDSGKTPFCIFHDKAQLVCPLCWSGRQGRTGEICDIKIDFATKWLRAAFVFI